MTPRAHRTQLRAAEGFTLLEMLVVLVITGMVTTILMQALGHLLRLEANFGVERFNAQQGEMYDEWFRQSVGGLMPDFKDGKNLFRGSEREFSGLTLEPLDVAANSLQPFAWRLEFDASRGETSLRYGRDRGPAIISWPGSSGRFAYLDGTDKRRDAWPPFLGTWPQLPKAIVLEYQTPEGPRALVAAPKGLTHRLPRLRDLEQ